MHDRQLGEDVRAFADQLRAEQAEAWAARLDAAERGGATGTEILFALADVLRGVQKDRRNLSRSSRKDAARLRRRINRQVRSI